MEIQANNWDINKVQVRLSVWAEGKLQWEL